MLQKIKKTITFIIKSNQIIISESNVATLAHPSPSPSQNSTRCTSSKAVAEVKGGIRKSSPAGQSDLREREMLCVSRPTTGTHRTRRIGRHRRCGLVSRLERVAPRREAKKAGPRATHRRPSEMDMSTAEEREWLLSSDEVWTRKESRLILVGGVAGSEFGVWCF